MLTDERIRMDSPDDPRLESRTPGTQQPNVCFPRKTPTRTTVVVVQAQREESNEQGSMSHCLEPKFSETLGFYPLGGGVWSLWKVYSQTGISLVTAFLWKA